MRLGAWAVVPLQGAAVVCAWELGRWRRCGAAGSLGAGGVAGCRRVCFGALAFELGRWCCYRVSLCALWILGVWPCALWSLGAGATAVRRCQMCGRLRFGAWVAVKRHGSAVATKASWLSGFYAGAIGCGWWKLGYRPMPMVGTAFELCLRCSKRFCPRVSLCQDDLASGIPAIMILSSESISCELKDAWLSRSLYFCLSVYTKSEGVLVQQESVEQPEH